MVDATLTDFFEKIFPHKPEESKTASFSGNNYKTFVLTGMKSQEETQVQCSNDRDAGPNLVNKPFMHRNGTSSIINQVS